ncbi:MAG: hypothetical protein ACJARD_001566 [Alphaproteobacteria bacterium]|jgi:hypothetical protein
MNIYKAYSFFIHNGSDQKLLTESLNDDLK